jgi:Tfp pilus assembly protein PilO
MYAPTREHESGARRLPGWLRWQPIVVGLALAGITGGLFFWLVIVPRSAERDRLASDLARLRAENAQNKQVVENFEAFMQQFEATKAQYEQYTERIPLEAEKERVSGDLERLTGSVHDERRGVHARVTLFETGKINPIQKDQPGLTSLSEVPVRVDIRGNYSGLKRLLSELTRADRLIAVRNYHMGARTDRAADDPNTINATVNLVTFFKRMTPAAAPPPPAAAPAPHGAT